MQRRRGKINFVSLADDAVFYIDGIDFYYVIIIVEGG